MIKHAGDFAKRQEQALPKIGLLVIGKPTTLNLTLDLSPSLKWWFLDIFGQSHAVGWKVAFEPFSFDGPSLNGTKRNQLFLDSTRAYGASPATWLTRTFADVGLHLIDRQTVNATALAQYTLEVAPVNFHTVNR